MSIANSLYHFLVMASTLYFGSCFEEFTHSYIKTLIFVLTLEQLICFTNQKEVIAQFFKSIPVSNPALTHFFIRAQYNKRIINKAYPSRL